MSKGARRGWRWKCTYSVVECSPLGVHDHFATLLNNGRVLQLGDVLNLLDIGTVRSRTKDSTKDASTGLVRSGQQRTDSLTGNARIRKRYDIPTKKQRMRTSLTSATHLTCKCFRSNASWSSFTTSFPIAFLAAKPLVQVSRIPSSRAVCSTGKENVRPRGMAGASEAKSPRSLGRLVVVGEEAEDVRKASTESAR